MKRRGTYGLRALVVGVLAAVCGVWLYVWQHQYTRDEQLIDALTSGDTKTALALVNAGANPNARYAPPPAPSFKLLLAKLLPHAPLPDTNNRTALMIACGQDWDAPTKALRYQYPWNENLLLVQTMLTRGANVNARTSHNRTALHYAVFEERPHTVELLLQHGANINAQDAAGRTPLMWAVTDGRRNMARLLLSHGANPNAQDTGGRTALFWAVYWSGDAAIVHELLTRGANPNLSAKNGTTPLKAAQRRQRPDFVRLLKRDAK